jgi:CubicO group peptidase (beta-lactamase class C family)
MLHRCMLLILLLATNCMAQDPSRMDSLGQYYWSNGQFMGSVLAARNDQILFSKSYGSANLEWNVPNTPATKFRIGSITKQFTAAAVLLLEEQGKLNINDPIKKHLTDSPSAWDQVTIFHILTHTSGIPSITNSPEYQQWMLFPMTPVQIIDKFRGMPLEFAPGEQFKYSNSGYILLGYLIEKISGQTYQNFIQSNIFKPLGMKDSGYDSHSDIIPRRASGYSTGVKGSENAEFVHMSVPFSAGALYSTTEDLLRWELGIWGGKLLSDSSLNKMTTPFKSNYGLGVSIDIVNGRKRISHGGGIQGFNAYIAYFPDSKVIVATLANLNGNTSQQIVEKMSALVHGDAIALPSERKEITVSPEILKQYVGAYRIAQGSNMTVTLEGTQMVTQITGQQKLPMFPESERSFFLKAVDATIEFIKDDKGAVIQAILRQGKNEIKATRINEHKGEEKAFDGTWVGEVKGPDGNPLEVTYVFEAFGKALLGTISTRLGGGPFSDGKIDGNNLSFVSKTDQLTLLTSGTLSGDVIHLTQKNGNEATQFTIKRITNGRNSK